MPWDLLKAVALNEARPKEENKTNTYGGFPTARRTMTPSGALVEMTFSLAWVTASCAEKPAIAG
jgi:hypothetical protein